MGRCLLHSKQRQNVSKGQFNVKIFILMEPGIQCNQLFKYWSGLILLNFSD